MTNARPSPLRLAVAIVISSSITATQALADRRLQVRSVDIQGSGHVEFTQSEIIVKPTLGNDQQPIPKSFTTTYPDLIQARAGYKVPSEGFTDVLSGIEGGVSSVDEFETDENYAAQKYTKVLKVGNEGVFRFSHNLEDNKLIIEVRNGMTLLDSIAAVRAHSGDIRPLEPLTKIASPQQLAGLLSGANERAGNLGEVDHYVALASIEVGGVEVNGRTFMRLIAAGDEPPGLQRLGQSLFVNDEALFAAATSAYTQVHVLGKDLQQEALNDLFSYHQPVGYVVNVEDDTQVYPVPAGYPKLEVTEAPGEIIVFHGQKYNPADIAFVDGLYDTWAKGFACTPPSETAAQVKKDKVKSYRYTIRSRQMALLEELAAECNAKPDQDGQTTLPYEDELRTLSYYEYLQQALTSATSDGVDEFELTIGHIEATSSVVTPTWMHNQLEKHFSFKPALRNLLTNPLFIQNILKVIPDDSYIDQAQADTPGDVEKFTSKVMRDISRQLIEVESQLEARQTKEREMIQLRDHLKHAMGKASATEKEKPIVIVLNQGIENGLAKTRKATGELQNQLKKLQQEIKQTPKLEQQLRDAREEARKAYNTQRAAELGINDWDDTQPLEEQARCIGKRIDQIHQTAVAAVTGKGPFYEEAVEVTLAAIEGRFGRVLGDENDRRAIFPYIQRHLQQNTDPIDEEIRLAEIEEEFGLTPKNEKDLEARHQEILQYLNRKAIEFIQQPDWKRQEQEEQKNPLQKLQQMADRMTGPKLNRKAIEFIQQPDRNRQEQEEQKNPLQKLQQITDRMTGPKLNRKAIEFIQQPDRNRQEQEEQKNPLQKLQQITDRMTGPKQQTHDARADTTRVLNAQTAKDPGIDDRDSTRPPEKKARLINQKTHEIKQPVSATSIAPTPVSTTLVSTTTVAATSVAATAHSQDTTLDKRDILESTIRDKLSRIKELEEELVDIRTPGHPKAMPEVLKTLSAVEEAMEIYDPNQNDDVYLRRHYISEEMQEFITKSREWAEEKAEDLLEAIEEVFNIEIDEDDDNAARLARVRARLNDDNIQEYIRDKLQNIWQTDHLRVAFELVYFKEDPEPESPDAHITFSRGKERRPKWLDMLRRCLTYKVEEVDKRAIEGYGDFPDLTHAEHKLKICSDQNVAAKERGLALTANLARDLEVTFAENHVSLLRRQKSVLRAKIRELLNEVYKDYDDEVAKRAWNNEMAHQLNIKDYEDDATIDHQTDLIDEKLRQLDVEVFKAGEPDVYERVAVIENELDRQMDRLGPKPRYVLDREVARARQQIQWAESVLKFKLAILRRDQELFAGSRADLQVQARLEAEIETRKADIDRLKVVLAIAEKTVESDGGLFQYTPKQVKVLDAIHTFMQQHPLRKQALEVAMGLQVSAAKNNKVVPRLNCFDFDDEFATILLQARVGKDLTFDQASRIVEFFKSLKRNFPVHPSEPSGDRPENVLKEIQDLVDRAWNEIKTGAQQYSDLICGIGSAGIHSVEHEPVDLKGFSEYFASHSASGNKIITLLREGLISKVELESYIKAVKRIDGYQTVDEFKHFLGYKHGVRLPEFEGVVRILSDEGAEALMQRAFMPVTVMATGPAGMKESVAGMQEYAAAVIANCMLDDIAFDNGRRTTAFLSHVQNTLTPYANAAGLSESDLIKVIHGTLMQAHAAAVERQLKDYWVKPSAFLVQAVAWYFSSYKPLLATHTASQASTLSLSNMSFLYLLDLTYRGDYLHRMLTPFKHWLEDYRVDLDRNGQYAFHNGIEQISEVGGLAMPLGKAASSVILLKTGSMLFARQHNANPHRYRSISRLVSEIVKSMGSGQGVQIPLLHRMTPQKVKTLASATAGLVLGPVATVGAYAHGLLSGFTYAQTFGFALASSLTFDFFMNDNKMLTQWLAGPLGRSLDKINRWRGLGETDDEYLQRTAIASPQGFSETDEEYASRVRANNRMYGWTRRENYLQFRERRDRTMKLFANGWEKYFRENVPKWSFSHTESIPYSFTLGVFFESL
ncbi:hypothetical protein [Endozoicomonas sp. 8E]|uniref:hypothetical protein n=1 Tax=Endozoicomonas sp. 8E TaxID=3035692 RepID=UPI002939434A|nr:hypothetical protein [Endozoicomonas sp. 8E]WOG29580.1 hypothetical protein P6910_07990 [Endozoicomonas sp. 8E]